MPLLFLLPNPLSYSLPLLYSVRHLFHPILRLPSPFFSFVFSLFFSSLPLPTANLFHNHIYSFFLSLSFTPLSSFIQVLSSSILYFSSFQPLSYFSFLSHHRPVLSISIPTRCFLLFPPSFIPSCRPLPPSLPRSSPFRPFPLVIYSGGGEGENSIVWLGTQML